MPRDRSSFKPQILAWALIGPNLGRARFSAPEAPSFLTTCHLCRGGSESPQWSRDFQMNLSAQSCGQCQLLRDGDTAFPLLATRIAWFSPLLRGSPSLTSGGLHWGLRWPGRWRSCGHAVEAGSVPCDQGAEVALGRLFTGERYSPE